MVPLHGDDVEAVELLRSSKTWWPRVAERSRREQRAPERNGYRPRR